MSRYAPCLLCVLLLFALPIAVTGQDAPLILTLDRAIDLALKESYDARNLALQLLQSEQNRSAARGRFRTNADLSLRAPNFTEQVQGINVPNQPTAYNTTGNLEWRADLAIRQPLPTNGAIGLTSRLRQVRDSVFLESQNTTQKSKRFFTSSRLELTQPLLVPNTLKLGLERANLQLEQAERSFTRTQLDIVYNVTETFYSLYRATRRLEIAREEMTQQQQSYDLARQKFEAGLIPEVEALQMEVDLAQSRNGLIEAEGNLSREADRFKLIVGLPLPQEIGVRTDFTLNLFQVDERMALEHGLRHRTEVRETEINRRLAEITLKETDARRTIRVDVSGFYELSGVSDGTLPFDTGVGELFRSSLSDLERRPRNRGVFLSVTLPLWDSGVNRSEVGAARAVVEQNALNVQENRRRVERDIRSAVTRLRETQNRLDVLKQSEDVARRSYDITLARFDNGDITSQELALDRDRLTQARTAYLEAYIQYQLAAADLKRQTLYDFENNRSLVETPEDR